MAKIIINGGKELFGDVAVSGSKNAALPIIFSTLALRGLSVIENVPDISDVRVAISIIESYGARVGRNGDTLCIDTSELLYSEPPASLISKIRASTYLIGASLARFGRVRLGSYGGCSFSPRPIDMHLYAAASLGAVTLGDTLVCELPRAANIVFDKISVGATVNATLIALSAVGKTSITPYAKEPHILAFFDFLRSAGAEIEERGDTAVVTGGVRLRGGRVRLPGDMIEAGTYLLASLITEGDVTVYGANADDLSSLFMALSEAGVSRKVCHGGISLSGSPKAPFHIVAAPHPRFPTDLQPIAAAALAKTSGGYIRDTVFLSRYGYLDELERFGVRYAMENGGARIFPSALTPATACARDLRCGAAALAISLGTPGVSVIENAETVMRGYEKLDVKLSSLGADIKIEK